MTRISRSIALTAGSALLVTGLVTGAMAQGEGGHRGRRGSGPGGFRGLAQLDLTDAQREQVRDVRKRHEAELKEARTRLRAAHDAQRQAANAVPVDEARIRATSQAMADAQAEMTVLRARVHSEIMSSLTPEQQAKAKELRAQRETRMKERRERMDQRRNQMEQRRQQRQG
jgi:protein CpxP